MRLLTEMIPLDSDLGLEGLQFLTRDGWDAIMLSSRLGHNLVENHKVLRPLRNLNLSAEVLHTHGRLLQRYTLASNTPAGNYTYERSAVVDGGHTETATNLAPRLETCWISYVTLGSTLSHFRDTVGSLNSCVSIQLFRTQIAHFSSCVIKSSLWRTSGRMRLRCFTRSLVGLTPCALS